jgi:hypothetical protein
MSRFSELTRIEAAIKNKSAKELEWSLWYCRMRQKLPTALPAHVKYWSGVEALVKEAIAPPLRRRFIRHGRRSRIAVWDWGQSRVSRRSRNRSAAIFAARLARLVTSL